MAVHWTSNKLSSVKAVYDHILGGSRTHVHLRRASPSLGSVVCSSEPLIGFISYHARKLRSHEAENHELGSANDLHITPLTLV